MMDGSKKNTFTQIGDLIPNVAGRLLDHPRSKGQKLWREWRYAAGPQMGRHTEPIKLSDGTLTVRVDSPVWNSQLVYLKPELLEKLQNRLPPGSIKDICFKHGSLRTFVNTERENDSLITLPKVSDEDEKRASDLVKNVSDPDIKEALRRVLLSTMARKQYEQSK